VTYLRPSERLIRHQSTRPCQPPGGLGSQRLGNG
jgi:hypothetical protein